MNCPSKIKVRKSLPALLKDRKSISVRVSFYRESPWLRFKGMVTLNDLIQVQSQWF